MAHADADTIIAQGVKVEGDFTSQGSVAIEGEVTGTVRTNESLRVGEQARIHADVSAANASVAGQIRGNIRVAERLELLDSAHIEGDVEAQVLSVAAGAIINGHISMGGDKGRSHGEAEAE